MSFPRAPLSDRRHRLNERLRAAFLAGAEEEWRNRNGRAMTDEQLARVLPRYPGDVLATGDGRPERPYLLLDVDGVLNPLCLRPPGRVPDGFTEHRLTGLRVLLAPAHGDWLRELSATYDLVWATSWAGDADRLIGPILGLPAGLPVITFGAEQVGSTVKLPAVIAFVGDRALAWLDDQLGPDEEAWASLRRSPTLLARTEAGIGLTREIVDQLGAFGLGMADPDGPP